MRPNFAFFVMRALIACAIWVLPTMVSASDFSGRWEVIEVLEDSKGFPWSTEIKYPKRFTLEEKEGRLIGNYVDQYGHACDFQLVAVLNGGHDLLLANCGTTKFDKAYAPIHHVKKVGNTLRAVVTTEQRVFEWVAKRQKQ